MQNPLEEQNRYYGEGKGPPMLFTADPSPLFENQPTWIPAPPPESKAVPMSLQRHMVRSLQRKVQQSKKDVQEGKLQSSPCDLPGDFPPDLVYRAMAAYSLLRTMSIPLRLSPFTPNVFLRALYLPFPNRLMGEIHVALLRILLPHSPPNQVDSRSSTFLPKFLVGWLPVGKRVSRYNARMYSQYCPSCPDNVVEDSSHLLQCPNRSDWQKQMFDELKRKCRKLDTDPNLFKLLATALNCWLNLAPFPAENFRDAYQPLISSQSQIGWQHLFYGRWSREWDMCQTSYLDFKGTPHTPFNHGQAWASKLIRIIWKHCHKAWTDRNLARHGKDEEHQKAIALAEAKAKIRSLYEMRPQCRLQKQQNWFHASPETHFETEPSLRQLNQWINSYGIMIQAVARRQRVLDELGQRGIDEAFELISHH